MSLRPLFSHMPELRPHLDEGRAVLTPNRRLSRAVRQADALDRAANGQRSWISSSVMPLRQYWIERWQQAVTRSEVRPASLVEPFLQRLIWRRMIDDDRRGFSLLSSSRAAHLCQQGAENLALWRIPLDDRAVRQLFSFGDDNRAFQTWYQEVNAEFRARSLITPEQAMEQLFDLPTPGDQRLIGLHLDDTPPLYEQLCKTGRFTALSPHGPIAQLAAPRRFEDPRAELEAAARWCREQCEQDPHGRYAVVLSDMGAPREVFEVLLRREFGTLVSDYDSLPVNFATGLTLDRVPLIADAMRILRLAGELLSVDDIIAVLDSPFIPSPVVHREQLEQQIAQLRDLARTEIPRLVMHQVLAPLVPTGSDTAPWLQVATLADRARVRQRSRAPSQWIPLLRTCLDAWRWAGRRALDSLEYQQLGAWDAALDRFASLDPATGEVAYDHACTLLADVLGQEQFQPQTSDRAVQVLGPLETTGLSFDAMWVTGMDANNWPASPRPNPYLPHGLQKQHRMPHVDAHWEWRRAQLRWQHWLGACDHLHCSHVARDDGAEVLASPLLASAPPSVEGEFNGVAAPEFSTDTYENVVLNSVPLSPDEFAADGVSSAVIQAQSVCPFRGFAAGRLQVAPRGTPAPGLLPHERGTLLHRALYQLFGTLTCRQDLRDVTEADLEQIISEAVADGLKSLDRNRRQCLGSAVIDLEATRLTDVLARWVSLEADRPEDFSVVAREEGCSLELGELHVRLRSDRRDEFADGSTAVLDYKSGAVESPRRWFEERPQHPQLLLYALANPAATGVAYASLKPGAMKFSGIAMQSFADGIMGPDTWSIDGETDSQRLENLRQLWSQELLKIAVEFVDGDAHIDLSVGGCQDCDLEALCRLGDLDR